MKKYLRQPVLDSNSSITMTAVSVLFLATSASTYAAEPLALNSAQLDTISAGSAPVIAASARGEASALSDTLALSGVRTNAVANSRNNGNYRVDTAYVSGLSYACCNGGTTSLDVEVNSNADTQVELVRVYSIESPLVSIKIGGGGIVGFTRL